MAKVVEELILAYHNERRVMQEAERGELDLIAA